MIIFSINTFYCSFACSVFYIILSLPIKGLTVGSGIKKKLIMKFGVELHSSQLSNSH